MIFYSIENRISDLYSSINFHIEEYSSKPTPEEEKITDKQGKVTYQITVGRKEMSESEKRKVFIQFLKPTIHHLANFKDNLKVLFAEKNLNEQIVEDAINNSKELCLVVDLSNQFKHEYPLTKWRRSYLDPKIKNIKYSWNIKPTFANIFHNPMIDNMIVDAEIVDKNNIFITPFTVLVEKSTTIWENLVLEYLPELAGGILIKRNEKDILENKRNKFQNLINEAKKILDNNEWIEIPYSELRPDMIVIGTDSNGVFSDFNKGIIRNIIPEKSKYIVDILTDFPMVLNSKIELTTNKWKLLNIKHPNDLVVLVHYFYSFGNKYYEILDLEKKYSLKHF